MTIAMQEGMKLSLVPQHRPPAAFHSLSSHAYDVLVKVHLLDGIAQRELARALRLPPTVLSRTLIELGRQGLVVRLPGRVDRRANVVHLTPLGRRRMEAIERAMLARGRTVWH